MTEMSVTRVVGMTENSEMNQKDVPAEDWKEKYYATLEQLTAAQSQLLQFQKELNIKEIQNSRLLEKIRKFQHLPSPKQEISHAKQEISYQEENEQLLPSLKVWPSLGKVIIDQFETTCTGKPRKRARKKCRDCHKDDCKGAISGPFGKLRCPMWVSNNPQKAIEYQEKLQVKRI